MSLILLAAGAALLIACYTCVIVGFAVIPRGSDAPLAASYTYQNRTQPVWSLDGKKILFAPMVVANSDGSGVLDLQIGKGHGGDFSPNGDFVVFANYRDGFPNIFNSDKDNISIETTSIDGSRTRRLTKPRSRNYGINPVWSPDGSLIAFVGGGPSVISPDGSSLQYLLRSETYESEQRSIGSSPMWSPDGRYIAYVGIRGDIYAIELDGLNILHLVNRVPQADEFTELTISQPAWSLDGSMIAFASKVVGLDEISINVVGLDGSPPREIVSLPSTLNLVQNNPRWVGFHNPVEISPVRSIAWSTDGSELFLESDPIVRIRVDGSKILIMDLPNPPFRISDAENLIDVSLSPDRTKIAYDYRSEHSTVFFTTSSDGSDKRLLHQDGTLPGWWYTEFEWASLGNAD